MLTVKDLYDSSYPDWCTLPHWQTNFYWTPCSPEPLIGEQKNTKRHGKAQRQKRTTKKNNKEKQQRKTTKKNNKNETTKTKRQRNDQKEWYIWTTTKQTMSSLGLSTTHYYTDNNNTAHAPLVDVDADLGCQGHGATFCNQTLPVVMNRTEQDRTE